jgi:hypothetical protein
MLVDGHFHADPHPGNVLVLDNGEIGLIDFGAAGRLDAIEQAALRQMMVAIATRDPGLLRQAVLDVATLRQGFDDDHFERALARFMTKHLGSTDAEYGIDPWTTVGLMDSWPRGVNTPRPEARTAVTPPAASWSSSTPTVSGRMSPPRPRIGAMRSCRRCLSSPTSGRRR